MHDVLMFSLNVWSSQSTFEAIGDFGWFYGDFFIPPEQFRHNLVYTGKLLTPVTEPKTQHLRARGTCTCVCAGIYRFLNNPDCVTGYAGFYGTSCE